MKRIWRLIFFLIGIVGFVILFWQFGNSEIPWGELLKKDVYICLGVCIGLWLVIYLLHTASYYLILWKDAKKVPFLRMFKTCVSGFALNNVTPAGLVGGEPYRIMELKPYVSIKKASSSTLTFSIFYIIGHIFIFTTTGIIYLVLGSPGAVWVDIIMYVCLAFNVFVIFFFFLTRKKGFVVTFMSFLRKIPLVKKFLNKSFEKNLPTYKEIDAQIIEFRGGRFRFVALTLIQIGTRLLEALEYLLIFYFLHININLWEAILIIGTASLVGNLLFMVPLQAGTRETGLVLGCGFIGIEAGVCAFAGIVYRIRDLICTFIGVILIIISGEGKQVFKAKKDKKEIEPEITIEKENE